MPTTGTTGAQDQDFSANPAVSTWRQIHQELDAEDAEAQRRRETVIVRAGVELPSERAARAIAASRRTGIRAAYLAEPGMLEEAEAELAKGAFDFDAFRKSSPAFAAWAALDPAHASLAAEDHRELARMEEIARQSPSLRARQDGVFEAVDDEGRITNAWRDPWAFKAAMRDARNATEEVDDLGRGMRATYGEGKLYQFATGALGSATSTLGLLGAVDRQSAGIVGGISEAASAWDSTLVAEVAGGAGGLAADAPLMLLGGPLARAAKGLGTIARAGAIRGLMATTPRAFMAGGRAIAAVEGSAAARVVGKAALTAAAVQPLALREGADLYAQGADFSDAATAWAIETVVPAAFGNTGVERFVLRGLSERAGKALYHSASTLLREAGLESTEEASTELAHAIHEVMSGRDPEALDAGRLARRLTVAGILGGGAGGAFNLPGFLSQNVRKDPAHRALAAIQNGNSLEALGAAAAQSKTTGQAPEEVERVLNQSAGGAEGFLDHAAWSAYWTEQRQDPRAMAQDILGDARTYDEALAAGHPLRVQLGTFAARLPDAARAHFAGEIRSEPDALNRREALASADALMAEDEPEDPAKPVDRTAVEQREQIAAAIEQQLMGAGAQPSVAAAQAQQMARVFAVTAKRAKLTPDQLFARYDLRINRTLPDVLAARDGIPDPMLDALRRDAPEAGDYAAALADLRAFTARHGIDIHQDNQTVRKAIAEARRADRKAALRATWQAEDDRSTPLDKARQMGADAAAAQMRALAEGKDGDVILDVALERLEAARTPDGLSLSDLMRVLGADFGLAPDPSVKLAPDQKARGDLFAGALRARGYTLASFADANGLLRREEARAAMAAGETWTPEQERAVADAFRLRDLASALAAGRLDEAQEAEAKALAERVAPTLAELPLDEAERVEIGRAVEMAMALVLNQELAEFDPAKAPMADTIDVDGKQRWTTNSNGKRIAKTEEAVRNFWRWFGDSKAVNEAGEPLVVYHQTNKAAAQKIFGEGFKADFPVARRQDEQVPDGFFFKPDTKDIKVGSSDAAEIEQIPVYLRILDPVSVADRSAIERKIDDAQFSKEARATKSLDHALAAEFDKMWARLPRRGAVVADQITEAEWESYSDDWQQRLDTQMPAQAAAARARLTAVLRERGNDGMVIEADSGSANRTTKTFIALDPTQIKSATANRGTFDPANPSILYQSAFHGTGNPDPYDRFRYDRVGGAGGEGAQAYGWGLYFTGKKEVAAHYRENLSERVSLYNGKPLSLFAHENGQTFTGASIANLIADGMAPDVAIEEVVRARVRDAKLARKAAEQFTAQAERGETDEAWGSMGTPDAARESARESIATADRLETEAAWARTLDPDKFTDSPPGKLYAVEVPEDGEMLDWDKFMSEQSESVRKALGIPIRDFAAEESLIKRANDAGVDPASLPEYAVLQSKLDAARDYSRMTGEQYYRDLSAKLSPENNQAEHSSLTGWNTAWRGTEGDKPASDFLRAAGIPGLTYMGEFRKTGGEGARNYVIFDDSKIVIKSYEQRKDTKRGQVAIGRRGAQGIRPIAITLFQQADLSTFLHESGHLYLELLGDLAADADAAPDVRDDYTKLLAWLGAKDRASITTEMHEKLARGYEAYLMEGKAPAVELRGAFARFKLWLLDLYKSARNLNVELTDEVRGVFDRLLATEEEITDAAEMLNARPLFADAKEAGMTDAEFLAYRERADEALDLARSDLEAQALAEIRREREGWWKEKLAEVRAEVELEVNRKPDQIAASVLSRGVYPGGVPLEPEKSPAPKLSSLSVMAWMDSHGYTGEGLRAARGRLTGMTAVGGVNLDAAAELFGYPSGDALMQALLSRRKRVDLIDALSDARMKDKHGDMMLDGSMAEAAKQAVENDARGALLVAEARALGSKVGAKPAPSELLRQQAVARIGRMPVKDLRPDLFRQAQGAASRRAFEAVGRGDHRAALIEKQRELLNYHLARAATEAVDAVRSDRDFLRRFAKDETRAELGKAGGWEWTVLRPDGTSETFPTDREAADAAARMPGSIYERTSSYVGQIDDILAKHDLNLGSNRYANKSKSLRAWIEERREAGEPVNIPGEVIDRAGKRHWRELTVDELGAVRDAVANIAHLAKVKNDLGKAHAERDLKIAKNDLLTALVVNVPLRATSKPSGDRTAADAAWDWLDGATAAHRKLSSICRQADGDQDGGPWWSHFVRPLNEAADREVEMRRKAAEAMAAIWKPWKDAGRSLDEKATVGGRTWTLNTRLSMALNWGNLGNRERLLAGDDLNEGQVLAVLDTLTQEDWTLVQAILDHVDGYWSDIKAKQERIEGLAPEKVEPAAIQTRFGTFRGGYYPVKYDPKRSAKGGRQEAATAANLYELGQATSATTRRGHTKARTVSNGAPLSLDVGVVATHLSQVIHDLTHHEAIVGINKLLRDRDLAESARLHIGGKALKQIEETVAAVAVEDLADNDIDRAFRYIRNGVSVATMGFSLSTMAMQVTGVGQSMQRVGVANFLRGVLRIFSDPARTESAWAFIAGKSSFMANRANTGVREVREVLAQVDGGGLKDKLTAAAYYGMQRTQLLVDIPTWYASYESALEAGQTDADAVALADQAVIDAQGSGLTKDLSGVQRSKYTALFTVFYSYFSTTYQRTAEAFASAGRRKRAGDTSGAALKLAGDLALLYTVPAMLAVGLRALMDKDDKDEGWLAAVGKEHLSLATGTIIGVRELSGSLLGGYEYRGPSGAMGFAAFSSLIKQAKQGDLDMALVKAAAQATGIAFHLPTLQAMKSLDGLLSYLDDRDASAVSLLFGPPPRH